MRKSILACTVSFLMSPMASWALGLGDVQVNSSLNQPLSAEIALDSVTKKDLDTLRVGLAPKAVYARTNVERSEYLSKFRFKLIERNGKHYISVTTRKAFREPFATFLVEANWRSGRLLREYTLLLDPPNFISKQAQPVATPSVSSSTRVKKIYTTPDSNNLTNETYGPSEKPNRITTPEPEHSGNLSYGPTAKDDTLWSIAKAMAPPNVSVNQMMLALLRDNPEAFEHNNINSLKKGYVLRIKDQETLTHLNRHEATQQAIVQHQNWQDLRQQQEKATNIVERDITVDESTPDAQLKLVTSGTSEQANNGHLENNNDNDEHIEQQLLLVEEDLESKSLENQELRARIRELEELVETKTSIIDLKDENLSMLQNQIDEQFEEEPSDEEETSETAHPKNIEEFEPESIDEPEEIAEPTEEIIKPKEIVNAQEKIIEPEEAAVVTEEIVEPKPTAVVQTKPDVKPKPKPIVQPEPEPEEGIVNTLFSGDALPYVAGGGGALALLLGGFFGYKKFRGKKENDFEESILDSHITGDNSNFDLGNSEIGDTEVGDLITEVSVSSNETSFLSDFSADDMESLQPDDTESDPISEADVFMVYGRYQQAEELLEEAIKKDPERIDYQMKLLEVYHGDKQNDSFILQSEVVKGLLQKSDDNFEETSEWNDIKSWASTLEIDLDNPKTSSSSASKNDSSDALLLGDDEFNFVTVDSVSSNPPLDDSRFAMPEASAAESSK